jgi:hypothetical protein
MSDAAKGQTEAELMREQRLQRNLKILVTGLGLLIVLGLMGIGYRMTTLTPSAGTSSAGGGAAAITSVATARGDIALELPMGAKVVSISISGNRLAVHHESPAGTGIAIIDLDTGKRIADVKAHEAVPAN